MAELVGEGCSNATIARRIGIAVDSVKKYISQVLAQTGCTNRTELALLVVGGTSLRRGERAVPAT